MIEYTISDGEICYIVKRLAHSLLCFIDQTPNRALNIYSSCISFLPLNHSHDTKAYLKCHSIPVSLHAFFKSITALYLL